MPSRRSESLHISSSTSHSSGADKHRRNHNGARDATIIAQSGSYHADDLRAGASQSGDGGWASRAARAMCTPRARMFAAVVLAFVVLDAVDLVVYTRVAEQMSGYGFIVTQLIWPVTKCILFVPPAWYLVRAGTITDEERRVEWWKFAMIALLNNVELYIGIFPSAGLPGALQTVINRLGTANTMIVTYLMLKTRYHWVHWLAAAMLVGAGVLAVAPDLLKGAGGNLAWPKWFYVVLRIVQQWIPVQVLNEKYMKASNIHVVYYLARTAVYQLLFALFLVPVLFVDLPGRPAIEPSHLLDSLRAGFECFAGYGVAPGDHNVGGSCAGSWQWWVVFAVMIAFDNICGALIVKYGSAAVNTVIGALVVPVTTATYQWRFIAGEATQSGLSWNTFVALAITVAAVLVYGSAPERSRQRTLSIVTGSDVATGERARRLHDLYASRYGGDDDDGSGGDFSSGGGGGPDYERLPA